MTTKNMIAIDSSRKWRQSLTVLTMLITALFFSDADTTKAGTIPPTAVQHRKLNKIIAEDGTETAINKGVTDLLGITKAGLPSVIKTGQSILAPAIAVKDDQGDDHQIQALTDHRGYIIARIRKPSDKARWGDSKGHIYWVSEDFVLISALSKAGGQPASLMHVEEALVGYREELAYWAAFADTN